MKKVVLSMSLAIASLCFVGCDVNPSKVDAAYAKKFISKVTYVKDERTGLCFALVGTRETASTNQNGISWTWVPCDSVEKFLEK